MPELLVTARAEDRLAAARRWLADRARTEELIVVAPSVEAGSRLVREALGTARASFGWHRLTPPTLAVRFAISGLALQERVPVGGVALSAICARVVHRLRKSDALGRFAVVGDRPGLPQALASTFRELGLSQLQPADLREGNADVASLYRAYCEELEQVGLCDRAIVLEAATRLLESGQSHSLAGLPVLWLDAEAASAGESAFARALLRRSADSFAVLPMGDERTIAALGAVTQPAPPEVSSSENALSRLQGQLFGEGTKQGELDASVVVLSAPGESRECVELVRRIHEEADRGTPYDRMGVLLRSPDTYRANLVEALRRGDVPAHFSRGARQPDPNGRALLALLACKSEDLSARAFAEYLSLGVVPDAADDGSPPAATETSNGWVPADAELVALPTAIQPELAFEEAREPQAVDEAAPVQAGTLRAPRRWERLLVDAAVIGGVDRWERRLSGLERRLAMERQDLENPEDSSAQRAQRRLQDVRALRAFALPLIEAVAALPDAGTWAEWIEALSALAERAIRQPARVREVLAELDPMGPVGPVDLDEVQVVLHRRLTDLLTAPTSATAGKVWIGSVDEARGMCFDVVFVPGLAEKMFPRKVVEDPILLDSARRALGNALPTNEDRVAGERLALRVAVGAATQKAVLSYPRIDANLGRPRVPSFYGLEILRAAEGRLPGFEELGRRAYVTGEARMGWPAPEDRTRAIDEAEYDLSVLESLLGASLDETRGAARYLLTVNPHLTRSLRFRARRWNLTKWSAADGLVAMKNKKVLGALLDKHRLSARPYSATALEAFSQCPYRFFLKQIMRVAPLDTAEPIEEIDPLSRGNLVHETQFRLHSILKDANMLPVTPERLEDARALLQKTVTEVAAEYEDDLAPAIERVWQDGIEAIRSDLSDWLARLAEDPDWVPTHAELAFGLPKRAVSDAASVEDPVQLDNGILFRGSIDLVEQRDGHLRATDHKTGKARTPRGLRIDGGKALQPVLYALALEKLFEGRSVDGGRLYYCTSRGGYEQRNVPLDDESRDAAQHLATVVGSAIENAFLPAAPAEDACRWCDYRAVCGPYEEQRTKRKSRARVETLTKLRRRK